MTGFQSEFLRTLAERGYIHQQTDPAALDRRAQTEVISAYIGFDATADSLHVGSLVQIMLLRRLQQAGHRPIVLMGGGTTKVGDPSGRDETRQLLTDEQINANIAGIRLIFGNFLRFDDSPDGRRDGQQRRLAVGTAVHPLSARGRPAFLHQSACSAWTASSCGWTANNR